MRGTRLFLLFGLAAALCLSAHTEAGAQSPDSALVTDFFDREQKRCDSLLHIVANHIAQTRVEIFKIIHDKALDTAFVCGPAGVYCKEGMSGIFKKKPVPTRIDMERDSQIVKLETLFQNLYEADVRRAALVMYREEIAALRTGYMDKVQSGDGSMDALKTALADRLAKTEFYSLAKLLSEPELPAYSFDYPVGPKPEIQKMAKDRSMYERFRSTSPEVPQENIMSAYPAKGQYNMYVHEPGLQMGWFAMYQPPEIVVEARYGYGEKLFLAQWTDRKGRQLRTPVYWPGEITQSNILFFDLPTDFLKPDAVYRLELGAVAKASAPEDAQTAVFSGIDLLYKDRTVSALPSAPSVLTDTLYSAFFRTSKYGSFREKVEKSDISYDAASGRYSVKTDEPFDIEECHNGAGKPFVAMDNPDALLPDRIYSRDMYYYFNVPRMQDLDTLHCPPYLDSEISHTYNTAAVIYPDLAVTVTFPEPPQPGVDTVWQNVPLPAAPLQSFLLDTTGLKDYTVTEAEFRKKRRSHPAGTYRLFFKNPGPVQMQQALVFSQEKIKERMLTRASYLFLEYRCRARRGLEDGSLDYSFFLEREKQYLPKSLREVLDWQITLPGNAGRKIYLYYFIPNTDQYSSLAVKLLNP